MNQEQEKPEAEKNAGVKTGTGLEPNIAGLLCYILGWVTGIIFLILEPQDKFVRFHAIQSIVVFGAFTVAWIIFGFIPFVGWIINVILYVLALVLWIVLMLRAYQGIRYKLPVAGDIADKQTS